MQQMARGKRFKAPKVSTVIGQGTVITGDVEFSGGLHLDGVIRGNVSGDKDSGSTLTVSEQGAVEGDVRVENLILNGAVVGDVYANERVELAANARVTGTVYYRLLEMAMGAEVNGQLVHSEDQEPRMLGYDGEHAPQAADEPVSGNT
jgi:cytoskeletal protein CcmA (bactofilin family)